MVNDQAATAGPKSENTIKKNFIVWSEFRDTNSL
jgi:hypothetical protein